MSSDEPEKARPADEAEDRTGETEAAADDTAAAAGDSADDAGGASDDAGGGASDDDSDDDTAADSAAGDEDGAGGEDGESREDAAADKPAGLPRWALLGAGAFATAAFVVAAVFGVLWFASANGDDANRAAERQDVVRVTGQAVTAFTELDHTKLDEYFERQKEISTGELSQQISQAEDTYRKAITEAKSKVTTTVHDIAVSELNEREGKASAVAAASTKVQRGDDEGTKTMRLEIQFSRDGEDAPWKVSQIGDVPVAGAGQQ